VSSPSAGLGVRAPLLKLVATERLPIAFAGLTVLSQIAYPLTSGAVRDGLTVITVLLWCAASLSHAVISRGWRFAGSLLLVTAGIGFGSEAIGTATGWPFGSYEYTSTLGPRLAGVPLIIPLAWTMMAYPALLVGRRIGAPVLGGVLAFASWDLFLDPQMVQAGHWHFISSADTGPALNSYRGPALNDIPLTNTAGWIVVAVAVMVLLSRLPEAKGSLLLHRDRVPLGLYLWTYVSSLLAAAVFFHRPGVALVGGLVMGIPTAMLVRRLHVQTHRP
jgi:uncharacterized membrane protein